MRHYMSYVLSTSKHYIFASNASIGSERKMHKSNNEIMDVPDLEFVM